jgi:hypothetical protein
MKIVLVPLTAALVLASSLSASALLSGYSLPTLEYPEPPVVSTDRESILPFVQVQK